MIKFPQSNNYEPGTWKGVRSDNERGASFTCPECSRTGSLIDHEINESGEVRPSVVCPSDGCSFHEFVKLEGWKNEK